jgi:hypothetical protein
MVWPKIDMATLAHERELSLALNGLRDKFDEWRVGKRTCWELSDDIHQFHDGENESCTQCMTFNYERKTFDNWVTLSVV